MFSALPAIRRNRGSTLGLVAMCALLVILALVAGFQLMVYFGSSQELKNSVDAGSLNVAMRAAEIRVPAPPATEYDDVADCNGRVGISNINRVWGKAYLINANAEEMNNSGYATSDSATSAKSAYTLATQLNNQLYNALTSGASSDVHFNQMAANKPAKLLKSGGDVSSNHDIDWATACMYPGEESNISFDPASLPSGAHPNQINMNNKTYLQGYNAMDANGNKFVFTTFHSNEAPHLITVGTFERAKTSTISSTTIPIPNAFKTAGQINGKLSLNAAAAAVANPMLTYQLQLPRAYVEVVITNQATGTVQGVPLQPVWYSPSTGKKLMIPKNIQLKPPAQGKLTAYGILGQEYTDLSLWGAIYAIRGDKTTVMSKLLQRVREMRPGFTDNQLKKLLQKIQIPSDAARLHAFIYCNDGCNAAGTLPDLQYGMAWEDDSGDEHSLNMPSFIPMTGAEAMAEGSSKEVGTEQDNPNEHNTAFSTILGPYPTDIHSANEWGVVSWQPGTGFRNNLGVMTINRTTNLTFTGLNPNK